MNSGTKMRLLANKSLSRIHYLTARLSTITSSKWVRSSKQKWKKVNESMFSLKMMFKKKSSFNRNSKSNSAQLDKKFSSFRMKPRK